MSLFTKDAIVAELRATRIALIPSAYLNDPAALTDDLIWDKARAAERQVSRLLGIPLEPTEIFPDEPTEAELTALAGKPYLVEPGYDLPPDFFSRQQWGSLLLRVRPVISISGVRIAYPGLIAQGFDVPLEWVRLDRKYGHVHFFPTAQVVSAPLSAFTMQAMGSGVTIPHMIRVRYKAGINANGDDFIDVLDVVKKMAMLKLLQDCYIPQSGSISADGLSQSMSADISKFEDGLHASIDSLREQLLGPIWGVL